MLGLYKKRETYERNLRNLEGHRRKDPEDAAARFVLAYHYLTATHTSQAKTELTEAVLLKPDDPVAKDLLVMISPPEDEKAAEPGNLADAALPAGFDVSGTWKATKRSGAVIRFVLGEDGRFAWSLFSDEEIRNYEGKYFLQKSRILFEVVEKGNLIGRIAPSGDDAFTLQAEGKKEEEGLEFERVK